MNTIALFGAAGKIGARIADKLKSETIAKEERWAIQSVNYLRQFIPT